MRALRRCPGEDGDRDVDVVDVGAGGQVGFDVAFSVDRVRARATSAVVRMKAGFGAWFQSAACKAAKSISTSDTVVAAPTSSSRSFRRRRFGPLM